MRPLPWPRSERKGAEAALGAKPNILVILTDDQGRGDYSAFGTKDIRTPHMDRLFREGMTFQNFFANSCVCSPSRAALLTGCYPDRVGVPGVIREETPDDSWGYFSPQRQALPQLLKPAGYHTAIIGKWHLGIGSPNTPTERGFDFFHGFLGDMMDDYWTHLRHGHQFHAAQPGGHRSARPRHGHVHRLGLRLPRRTRASRAARSSSTSPTTRRTTRSSRRRSGWRR